MNQSPSGTRCSRVTRLVIATIVIASFLACGPSKPTGEEYLGKWSATWSEGGGSYLCPLVIARNGNSFLITVEGEFANGNICSTCRGIFTLTPEGNLKGGPMDMVVLSYDKANDRIILSYGGQIQHLDRPMAADVAAKLSDSIAACISSGRTACLAELHASGSDPEIVKLWATDVARYKGAPGLRVIAVGLLDKRWVGPSLSEHEKGAYPGEPVGQIQISGGGDGRVFGVLFGRFGDRYLLMRPGRRKP